MSKSRNQKVKTETEEILSEIRQSKDESKKDSAEVQSNLKTEQELLPETGNSISDLVHESHLKKTKESLVPIEENDTEPTLDTEPTPDTSPYTGDDEDESELVHNDKEIEDYKVSKWLTLLDDLANPFTIDLSSIKAFSAMSKEEIEDMFDTEEFLTTPQFRNGVRAYTEIFPEGVCLFGIDHDTFEQALMQYEERG